MEIAENDNEKNSIIELIGKGLILFGMLLFVTYFMVRMYAIYRGGGAEFYGVALFMPDRFLLIIAASTIMVFLGVTLYFINKKIIKSKEKQEA